MSTHLITVYDYEGISFGAPQHMREEYRQKNPKRYDVEAWCLGGPEGIRAWFIIGDTFYEAAGDDGHWWLTGTMNTYWVEKFKETVALVSDDKFEPTRQALRLYDEWTATYEEMEARLYDASSVVATRILDEWEAEQTRRRHAAGLEFVKVTPNSKDKAYIVDVDFMKRISGYKG